MEQDRIAVVFPIVLGVWVVLSLAWLGFLFFNRNAALKRRVLGPFLAGVGVLFVLFVALLGFPVFVVCGAAVLTPLILLINMRGIRFCDGCGRTLFSQNPFVTMKFCPACGQSLEPPKGGKNGSP